MFRICVLSICVLTWLGCVGAPDAPLPGDIATAYHAEGRLDEATREIDLAVRTRPRDLALRRQAARIHAEAGGIDRAIGHLEIATQLAPNDPSLWMALGDLETGRQNDSDAYVAYRRAAKLEPDDMRAASELSRTAEALGFSEEAEAAYERWESLKERAGEGP
jgi:tetratricopeptide (TPR) repeat protein